MFRLCGETYRWRTKTWIKMTREYRKLMIKMKVEGTPIKWYSTRKHKVATKLERKFKVYKDRMFNI